MTRALLVSLSAPEMDRLAVELAKRGALNGYVRRYANKNRWWERSLAKVPGFGSAYASTLGRRQPPAGLDNSLVIEAGFAADVGAAITNRLGRSVPNLATRVAKRLQIRTEEAVTQAAADHVAQADVVIGSYHVASAAFTRARALGRRTILNYPIAHHRWQYRFYAEQARREPAFAAALPDFGTDADRERHANLLDGEIALADLILVGSHFVRDTFISEGIPAERLQVIPYGADSQRFTPLAQPKPGASPFRALFVGQLGERKGISYLLKAYQAFRKADTELHLVGDYVRGSDVYAPYRSLYRHTQNVPQKLLPDLMRSADVFVFPTLVEGMPMVVLEAMACGLPVIVTPNGPAEVVRDGVDGFVIPCGDTQALVDRLERLYRDHDLRLQMGRNARQQAERWPWARYARVAADVVLGAPATDQERAA